MRRMRSLALAAWVSITAGCLSHREYRQIYSLEGVTETPAASAAGAAPPVIQLQRVLIPDYLDTTAIVLRMGAHEMHESTKGRFAERLSSGVTRALRSDLASRLPLYDFELAQSGAVPQLLVNVNAFDVWASGRCVLIADWTILGTDRKTALATGRGTFTTQAVGVNPGDEAIVTAMAQAVRQLADNAASTIAALPAGALGARGADR